MLLLSTVAVARPPTDHELNNDYKDFSIQTDPHSVEVTDPVIRVEADLGSLKSGEKGIAIIRIRNPFEHDIPIENVRASCSCSKSMLLGKSLPAGGTAQLLIAIDVPKHQGSAKFAGTVSLGVDRTTSPMPALRDVIVSIRYNIEGMLSFVDRQASFAIRQDSERTILIPFVATIPGVPESIDVDGSGFVVGTAGMLVQVDGNWFVQLKVDSEIASPQGAFGQIKLIAKDSGVSDTINLALFIEDVFQISPRTLRFRPFEDGFEATGILSFSGSKKRDRGADLEPTEDGRVFCEAFIGEQKLDVELHQLSSNVHRLRLVFGNSKSTTLSLVEAAKGTNEITWNVIDHEKRHLIKSNFFLAQ